MTPTPDQRVGRIVRVLLADRGLKQNDLARHLGMDSGQMSRSMRGHRKWTLTEIEAMAAFFSVGVATFFEDPDRIVRSRCSLAYPDGLGVEQLALPIAA